MKIFIALTTSFGLLLAPSAVRLQASQSSEAIKRDDFSTIKLPRQTGANPNVIDTQTGVSTLHDSAERNDIESVRTLLKRGATTEVRSHDGSTPLLLATRFGNAGVVQLLRCAGADPNAEDTNGETPLAVAAAAKRDDLEHILKEPECSSPGLLDALEDSAYNINENVKVLFEKLKSTYGASNYPVYTGTILQEVFFRMGESARQELLTLLIDGLSVPNLRLEASLALHRCPRGIAVPAIMSALGNSAADVRLRLLDVIAALDLDAAKPYLERSLNDPDHGVRAYAKALLEQLLRASVPEAKNKLNINADARPELIVKRGHLGAIQSMRFTPDERYVLTGSDDRTAVLWDVASGSEIRRFESNSFSVESVDISPDGNYIATGSENGVAVSGLRTNQVIRIPTPNARSVAFSSDSKYLAVAGSVDNEEVIHVWNIATGAKVPDFVFNLSATAVQFSPTEQYVLAIGASDVTVLDLDSKAIAKHFVASNESFISGAFSRSGLYVLTAGLRTVRIWDVKSGNEVRRFYRDSYDIPESFDAKGCGQIAMKSLTVMERVKLISVLAQPYKGFTAAALSPHLDYLVTGSWDSTAQVWDVGTGRLLHHLRGHDLYVSAVSFSPTGKYVLTGSADRTVGVWNWEAARLVQRLDARVSGVTALANSSADSLLLAGDEDGIVHAWNLKTGNQVARLKAHDNPVEKVVIAPDTFTTISCDNTVRMWDRTSFVEKARFDGKAYKASVLFLDATGSRFVTSEWNGIVAIRGFRAKDEMIHVSGRGSDASGAALSMSGKRLLTWTKSHSAFLGPESTVWDLTGQKMSRKLSWRSLAAYDPDILHDRITFGAFSGTDKTVMTGTFGGKVILWDAETGTPTRILRGHTPYAADVGIFSSHLSPPLIVTGGFDATARLWESQTPVKPKEFVGHSTGISSLALISKDRFLATGSYDGTVRIWNIANRGELLRLISLQDGSWFVVTRDGRFDTNNLEEIKGLSWVFPDQLLRPLAPEIFMRDYFEPRLLPRLLAGEKFKKLKSLTSLNRLQPSVEVKAEWDDEENGVAKVTVKVSRNSDPEMKNSKMFTKPYDVRVFRDGQLVGWAPETSVEWQLEPPPSGPDAERNEELDLQRWREKTEIKDLGPDGTKELPPFLFQVPRRTDLKQVTFTAYAFNEDRVKSATASATLEVKKALTPRVGNAYLISVGVNRTESSPNWDLQYAANDARQMSSIVTDKLEGTKQFAKVVPIRLVSDKEGKEQPQEAAATKAHVQAVLDVLAGRRTVDEQLKKEIPRIDEVEKAQPEDLVLLAFSSHGYTDDRGVFHMVLADIGRKTPQDKITAELREKSLSSDELSGWLREVDAGEMVMVVDSCHSAATVEAEGFKPGPMGSRGLGQMAYDKGMRILAASKSEQSAVEREGIEHGLLSYALVEEGLKQGLADFQPPDGKIMMGEWLAYGEQEVPKLFQKGDAKGVIQEKGGPETAKEIYHGAKQTPQRYQQPVLFDFSKNASQVAISSDIKN